MNAEKASLSAYDRKDENFMATLTANIIYMMIKYIVWHAKVQLMVGCKYKYVNDNSLMGHLDVSIFMTKCQIFYHSSVVILVRTWILCQMA